MVKRFEVLAIIPARAGSKSIPDKNIKLLAGFPLIAYSIAAGLKARFVSRVIVSTDDEEIAGIARDFGAEVPFIRPAELALDDTPDLPVFAHALNWLKENENYVPDIVVQLRPTTPFRPVGCVDEAVRILLADKKADSVRGVVLSIQNPFKMWNISKTGYMEPLLNLPGDVEAYNQPRQKLPITYFQTGHVDAIRLETITQKNSMTGEYIKPLIIDPEFLVDIDTKVDWARAEWVMKNLQLAIVLPQKL